MKILLVSEFYSESASSVVTGGVEIRTFYVVKYLRKLGHTVNIISRSPEYVSVSLLSILPRLWFIIWSVWEARKYEADIVEGSNYLTHLSAFIIAKIKRVPAVAWFADVYKNDWFENFSLFTATLGFLLESLVLKLPWDKVIAISESTRKKLIRYGIAKSKIALIYGGVETKKIMDLEVGKFKNSTVVTLARLVEYKRVQDLILAMIEVKKKLPGANLVIAGDGPYRKNLEDLVRENGLDKAVRFYGSLTHEGAIRLLKNSHIFCLPSLVEGFGLVTVEAMAAGVPYVNSDIPPTREITDGGKGGILYKPKNERQLAEEIVKLLKNEKLYKSKVKEGKEFVKKYDWSEVVKQTGAIYKKSVQKA